jgi:hypothetical protein
MAISIIFDGEEYQVSVSPPHGWERRDLVLASPTEVLSSLSKLGVHSTDITDALSMADPGWGKKHDAEVLRRRQLAESCPPADQHSEDPRKTQG